MILIDGEWDVWFSGEPIVAEAIRFAGYALQLVAALERYRDGCRYCCGSWG